MKGALYGVVKSFICTICNFADVDIDDPVVSVMRVPQFAAFNFNMTEPRVLVLVITLRLNAF